MCRCVYVCRYVYGCICVYLYIYRYVYGCICVYVCIWVKTHLAHWARVPFGPICLGSHLAHVARWARVPLGPLGRIIFGPLAPGPTWSIGPVTRLAYRTKPICMNYIAKGRDSSTLNVCFSVSVALCGCGVAGAWWLLAVGWWLVKGVSASRNVPACLFPEVAYRIAR